VSKVKRLKDRNAKLAQGLSNWNQMWQVLGEFITQTKTNFEETLTPGEFLNEDIFDSTATFAAGNAASAILGLLWPSTAKKSIKIEAPDDLENPTDEEIKWYQDVATKRLVRSMDDPKANLALALDEYMLDEIIFGTSGVGTFLEDGDLMYRAFTVKEMRIDEGKNGRIDTTFLNYEWTVKRVVDTYGEENVSEKTRKKFEDGNLGEMIKILIVYEPGDDENFPTQSTHMEMETEEILKEGGFAEFPIAVARFRKLIYEKYGRSPGMNGLPDIRELNILKEAVIVATEKELDPALGVLNSGMLGGGVIDTSAGGITVFDSQGNIGSTPPVFEIRTVGDLNAALSRIDALEDAIAQHFFIDRLLDFNNRTQMTATETVERARIRNSSLSSLISRQLTELFTPLVERSFNVKLRANHFGFIPGSVEAQIEQVFKGEVELIPERIAERLIKGEDAYQITYTTPADRVTNIDELQGMLETININQTLAATNPEAVLFLDVEEIQKHAVRLTGAPPSMIKHIDEVKEIMRQREEQAAQQQQIDQAEQVAGIASDLQANN